MTSFLVSFITASVIVVLLIRLSRIHDIALDSDLASVQKVHVKAVPRIGGIGILIAVLISGLFTLWREPYIGKGVFLLLYCSMIPFLGGIVEDFTKKVSPSRRLVLTMVGAILGYFVLDAKIERFTWITGEWYFDYLWIALPLTVFAVAGIANAINIIDGFNGLATVVVMCMLLSLAYVALQVNDSFIVAAALIVAGATAGFLIWNYPGGLIFLGDGGAYFLGFMLGELSILLVMRNPQVSTWYALLLLIYPVFETLFSIYRRFFLRGLSPSAPDGVHLHSLIFRRVVVWAIGEKDARALTRRNAMTSPYLWLLSLMAVVPATLFWNKTMVLMIFAILFIVSYVWLYSRIVRFKSPRWMMIGKRK